MTTQIQPLHPWQTLLLTVAEVAGAGAAETVGTRLGGMQFYVPKVLEQDFLLHLTELGVQGLDQLAQHDHALALDTGAALQPDVAVGNERGSQLHSAAKPLVAH